MQITLFKRLFYHKDYKVLDYIVSLLRMKYDINEVWIGLDRRSDESSTRWTRSDGKVIDEIPWNDGYPTTDESQYCAFLNVTSGRYIFVILICIILF